MISKIVGQSFEIYCKADVRFNVCIFKWNQVSSKYCVFANEIASINCPGEMTRVDNDKCVVKIDR